jgi:hypothetical protein
LRGAKGCERELEEASGAVRRENQKKEAGRLLAGFEIQGEETT